MKTLRLSFLSIIISCTSAEFKDCKIDTQDEQLRVYHDILTQLIEHHMFNGYLNGADSLIYKGHNYDVKDSFKINGELTKLQNELFRNPSAFCVLMLDTTFRFRKQFQENHNNVSLKLDDEIVKAIDKYSINGFVADSLYIPYPINVVDIGLCTARMEYLNASLDDTNCTIGKIQLSKAFFNSRKTHCLIYYDWVCGPLCGRNMVVILNKQSGKWIMKDKISISVY